MESLISSMENVQRRCVLSLKDVEINYESYKTLVQLVAELPLYIEDKKAYDQY